VQRVGRADAHREFADAVEATEALSGRLLHGDGVQASRDAAVADASQRFWDPRNAARPIGRAPGFRRCRCPAVPGRSSCEVPDGPHAGVVALSVTTDLTSPRGRWKRLQLPRAIGAHCEPAKLVQSCSRARSRRPLSCRAQETEPRRVRSPGPTGNVRTRTRRADSGYGAHQVADRPSPRLGNTNCEFRSLGG
jgi:hypothetical protein